MMGNIALASMYNEITGAGVTHRDVQTWGFLETELVFAALDLLKNNKS